MADLTYTTLAQEQIARDVLGLPYTDLTAAEKEFMDGTATVPTASPGGLVKGSLTKLQQVAQAFELGGATSAPDVWEQLLILDAQVRLATARRPDTVKGRVLERNDAYRTLLSSFTKTAPNASASAARGETMQGVRFYVLSYGVRLPRPVVFDVATIDDETMWCLNWAWHSKHWDIRRRASRININVVAFTGATWVESTKTLTKASGFTNFPYTGAGATTNILGSRAVITSGTSVFTGDALVATKASANALTLETSISATAADLTAADIEGYVVSVQVLGLGSGEAYDSLASRELYYQTNSVRGNRLKWSNADDMARLRATAVDPATGQRGMPVWMRTEDRTAKVVWYFAPDPDQNYQVTGEVFVGGPGTPTSATDVTPFEKFPAPMRPYLKDLVLARVYSRFRVPGAEEVWKSAVNNIINTFPVIERRRSGVDGAPRDVYQDFNNLTPAGGAW